MNGRNLRRIKCIYIYFDPASLSVLVEETLKKLQQLLRIKVNEYKSSYVTFTLRKGVSPAANINQTIIPQTEAVKYIGLHLDCTLNWKEHIARKRKQIDLKTKEINWPIGKKSHLSTENKLLIYKAVIKSVWSHGIELWGLCQQVQHSHHGNIPI
jgi:hypothetical protein